MTCFARDKDSDRLWNYFAKGKNVLMLAPRRIGILGGINIDQLDDEIGVGSGG